MATKIHLGKDKYLISDSFCWYIGQQIVRHGTDKETGEKTESEYMKRLSGFHTNLPDLMESYFDKTLLTSDVDNLKDMGKLIHKTKKDIREWYKQLTIEGDLDD